MGCGVTIGVETSSTPPISNECCVRDVLSALLLELFPPFNFSSTSIANCAQLMLAGSGMLAAVCWLGVCAEAPSRSKRAAGDNVSGDIATRRRLRA